MKGTKILVSGLPGSGKTTFIAALWCYVKSASTHKSLAVSSLAGVEHEYLNSIANDWMAYQIPGRSLQNMHFENVILPLKKVLDGQPVTLEIPDIAGEKFRDHFDLREWSREFDALLNNVTGMLVFINPLASNNRPHFIAEALELEALLADETTVSTKTSSTAASDDKETLTEMPPKPTLTNWDAKFVPNQVKIVEGLQFLHHHKTLRMPIKLSIIISAWDAVEGADDLEPDNWLQDNLPLFNQFLQCNTDKFSSRVFGISAQGGDYEIPEQLDALTDKKLQDRIKVKQGKETHSDITQTIFWMTE